MITFIKSHVQGARCYQRLCFIVEFEDMNVQIIKYEEENTRLLIFPYLRAPALTFFEAITSWGQSVISQNQEKMFSHENHAQQKYLG